MQLAQSGLFATGDYLTGDIAAGTTVVSSEGDGTISLIENQLDYTDTEYLWSFELSNGSTYSHATKISSTSATYFDTSGNGRHLTLANDTAVDADAHCHGSIFFGSDTLNDDGFSAGGLGSELIDTSLVIVHDFAGSAGAFIESTWVIENTAIGTNTSYPRFRFPIGSKQIGATYQCYAEVLDSAYIPSVRLSTAGTDHNLTKTGNVFSGDIVALDTTDEFQLVTYGLVIWSTQIVSMSVKQLYLSTVLIPALSDGTTDCIGNPLTHPGSVKLSATTSGVSCISADGTTGDYVTFAELIGTEEVVSSGGTSTPEISAGRIDFTLGTCWWLVLDNGWTIAFSETEGVTLHAYDIYGNTYTGTIHATDIGAMWSTAPDGAACHDLHGYTQSGTLRIPANPYDYPNDCLGSPCSVPPNHSSACDRKFSQSKELMGAEKNITGDELWVDPVTETIDENTYSTYDTETGICRIVSDGTYIQLAKTCTTVGDTNQYIYEKLEGSIGDLKILEQNPLVEGPQEIIQNSETVTVQKLGVCDVTFKLSVRKLNNDHAEEILFDAAGTPLAIEYTGDPATDNKNNQLIIGKSGVAVYSTRQIDDDVVKIQKRVDRLASYTPLTRIFGPTWSDDGTWDDSLTWEE